MFYLIIPAAILLAILVILFLASQKPDDFNYSRSILVKAEDKVIFNLINDFKEWAKWSPYETLDVDLKKTYSGSQSGVGAIYEYEGKKAGSGIMEITNSEKFSKIDANLVFTAPMKAENKAHFNFEKAGEETKVTWSMTGKYNLISKVVCLFLDLDKFVGKDFEKGLENIKNIAEKN